MTSQKANSLTIKLYCIVLYEAGSIIFKFL